MCRSWCDRGPAPGGRRRPRPHRLGLSYVDAEARLANARSKAGATTTAQLVCTLAPRLPGPIGGADPTKMASVVIEETTSMEETT